MVNSVDLLFITETWFHTSIDSKCLSLFGQFEVLCRTDRKSEWQVQIISELKQLYIANNNEFPNNNVIAGKIQSLGLDARYAKKSMPFVQKVISDVTTKGQSVFDESTLFSGNHGGVAILAKKSLRLHLIPLELPATYDFASLLIWLLPSGSALIFLLVYLPPKTSSYVVSPQELSNCIDHAKESSSTFIPSSYTFNFCLLGDFNMPDTDWNSMYSASSFENQYLDIFISHGLSASINFPTHKDGNILDNILLENVNQFDDFLVDNDLLLSDHSPILFNCVISNLSSKSTPLASSYSFNSAKQISSFIDSWSIYTFTDCPSAATVDSFYSHLNYIIPQTFSRKTKKRLNSPFYYSSHSMHCLNIIETSQRKCIRNPTANNLFSLKPRSM